MRISHLPWRSGWFRGSETDWFLSDRWDFRADLFSHRSAEVVSAASPEPFAGAKGDFDITIVYSGSWTASLKSAFSDAVDRFESIIRGDEPSAAAWVGGSWRTVDDVAILGRAGPTSFRASPLLPAAELMRFDVADAKWSTVRVRPETYGVFSKPCVRDPGRRLWETWRQWRRVSSRSGRRDAGASQGRLDAPGREHKAPVGRAGKAPPAASTPLDDAPASPSPRFLARAPFQLVENTQYVSGRALRDPGTT